MRNTDYDHEIKQNATERIPRQFVDANDTGIDVSSNTNLKFFLRDREPPDGDVLVNADAAFNTEEGVGDGTDGWVEYELSPSETGRAGVLLGEFFYESADGTTQKYAPTGDEYILILNGRALGTVNASDIDEALLAGNVDADGNEITNLGSLQFAQTSLPTTERTIATDGTDIGIYLNGSFQSFVGGGGDGTYSDADAIAAINNDTDHGSTASHAPSDLEQEGATSGDHIEWDGSEWAPAAPPTGIGGSLPDGFVDVSAQAGGDLGAKINNALSALPASPNDTGVLVIPPRSDGANWTLSTSVTHDTSSAGLEIWTLGETKIDIDSSHTGWVFDFSGGSETWNDPVDRVTFKGGYWEFADAWDGSGFLRADDMYGLTLNRHAVIDCRNSTADAVVWQLRNVEHFSEGSLFHHLHCREVDIGVDFVSADASGGTAGTESFHNTRMDHVHIDGCEQVGVRFRDSVQLAASGFSDVAVWPNADGVVAWDIDAEPDGCSIYNPKVEAPAVANLTAFRIRNTAFKRIHIYDPMFTGVDTVVDAPGDGQGVLFHNLENNGAIIQHDGFRAHGLYVNSAGEAYVRDVINDTETQLAVDGSLDASGIEKGMAAFANGAGATEWGRPVGGDHATLELDASGTGDAFYPWPVFLEAGETLYITQWSLGLDDGTSDSNLTLRLDDETNSSVTTSSMTSAPFLESNPTSYENTTGGAIRVEVQLENDGATDYTGSSAPDIQVAWNGYVA